MNVGSFDTIDHVAVTVKDLEQSVTWYTTSFDCSILYRDRTQAILQFSNIKLALVLPSQEPTHVAYFRSDAATLGELRSRADGSRSTFISDPTGNPVEIVAVPYGPAEEPEQSDA